MLGSLRRPLAVCVSGLILSLLSWTAATADYEAAQAYSEARRGISLVVMRDGEIVHESYARSRNRWRRRGGEENQANLLASGTKSFSGLIAAAAVQDGLLSLDERAADTLTEWANHPDLSQVTIRQLLHLTAGLPGLRGSPRRMSFEDAVAATPVAAPGEAYVYGQASFQAFGALMSRKLAAAGRNPDPVLYLQERILDPLGVAVAWRRHQGDALLGGGARMTARDWARFGEFVRLGGRWGGRQLVDAQALAENFQGSAANPAYGLTWWLNAPVDPSFARATPPMATAADLWTVVGDTPADTVMAAGAGNQRLYIIPSLGLVVARQADGITQALLGRQEEWSDVAFLEALLAP